MRCVCVCDAYRLADHRLTVHHGAPHLPVGADASGAAAGAPLFTVSVHGALPRARACHEINKQLKKKSVFNRRLGRARQSRSLLSREGVRNGG